MLLISAGGAHAQKLGHIRLSDTPEGEAATEFRPDTPRIHMSARAGGIAPGSRLRCEWIAVKAQGAPANYRIDFYEATSVPGTASFDCSLSRPSKGWPEGEYRVDVTIEGREAGRASFRVVR